MFKVAKVIPIYKKGDKHDKNKYRPISILPVISLTLERHVSQYLKKLILKPINYYITDNQDSANTTHAKLVLSKSEITGSQL